MTTTTTTSPLQNDRHVQMSLGNLHNSENRFNGSWLERDMLDSSFLEVGHNVIGHIQPSNEGTPAATQTPSMGIPSSRMAMVAGYWKPHNLGFKKRMLSVMPSPGAMRSMMRWTRVRKCLSVLTTTSQFHMVSSIHSSRYKTFIHGTRSHSSNHHGRLSEQTTEPGINVNFVGASNLDQLWSKFLFPMRSILDRGPRGVECKRVVQDKRGLNLKFRGQDHLNTKTVPVFASQSTGNLAVPWPLRRWMRPREPRPGLAQKI